MSYDVALVDPVTKETLPAPERVMGGGTYPVGGRDDCEFNITYNYAQVFGGLVSNLDGKTAGESLHTLQSFVDAWPNAKPWQQDYWAPTPGNAKAAIEQLIIFAKAHPQGVWVIS